MNSFLPIEFPVYLKYQTDLLATRAICTVIHHINLFKIGWFILVILVYFSKLYAILYNVLQLPEINEQEFTVIQKDYRRQNGTVHRKNYPFPWRLILFVPGGWNLDRYPSLYWTRTRSWRTDNRDMSRYTWILLSGIFSFFINEAPDFMNIRGN